jgi:hypothetical protein
LNAPWKGEKEMSETSVETPQPAATALVNCALKMLFHGFWVPQAAWRTAMKMNVPRRFAHFHVQWRAEGSWESVVKNLCALAARAWAKRWIITFTVPTGAGKTTAVKYAEQTLSF